MKNHNNIVNTLKYVTKQEEAFLIVIFDILTEVEVYNPPVFMLSYRTLEVSIPNEHGKCV